MWGFVRGGMGAVTSALADVFRASGGEIRTECPVAEVRLDVKRRAGGVVLEDGEEIDAPVVCSNADPKRTFLRLVPKPSLDPAFVSQVERLRTRAAYLKFHAALRELPDFTAYIGADHDPRSLSAVRICPSVDWSSVLTLAYPTTAMLRSMLKVWQAGLQPSTRPFPDYSREEVIFRPCAC